MTTIDRLNKGDLILITGVTGLLGAQVADDLLSRGFKVRGVSREKSRTVALGKKLESIHGPGLVEFVEVSNPSSPGAYAAALEGVSGFIHLAVDLSFAFSAVPDPKASIASAIDMTLGILKSALQVPSMRAAVVCSSIAAMYHPEAGKAVHPSITEYNDLAIELAHSLPDDHPFKGPATYMASKTEAEKGLWSWVSDVKPAFSVNTILPSCILGPAFNPESSSTSTWLTDLFQGQVENNSIVGFFVTPQWVVDVRDSAVVLVAALLASDINHQRLIAAGTPPVNINRILAIWREAYPQREIVPDFSFPEPPTQELDREVSTALLKRYVGRDWYSLEKTVLDNVSSV